MLRMYIKLGIEFTNETRTLSQAYRGIPSEISAANLSW